MSSDHEPLLHSTKQEDYDDNETHLMLKLTRWFLKFAMSFVFIGWVCFLFLLPSESVSQFSEKYVESTSGSVFWVTGSLFLFGGPIFIIAFLAILYLRISGEQQLKKPKHATFRLWTFPVIVDGPFGVVTAAELIVILLVVVYLIWAVSVYAIQNYNLIPYYESQGKRNVMLKHTGLRFGSIGLICLVFLFLPVARGSILLRLTNIPFEHATRYHVWLGHLTMTLFTLHGLCYFYSWILEDRVLHQVINWKNNSIANLPGVISLSAGLLMWVTSLPPVRRLNFELFYYTHQLYVVFIVFFAMHVGDIMFSVIAAGLFLYMLDRFLRFFQSRKTVDILSAKCLPSGTLELVISKPQDLQYNALSWVFLQVRDISWLQWHPFSVSSSPLNGDHHVSILIKVLGNWTKKLKGHVLAVSEEDADALIPPNSKLKASVEGPYGHELPYHLMYENLVLVAGGIGISPFLAILSDILHRVKDSKPCMPRNVSIIWAVRTSEELPLLHSLDLNSISPYFYNKLNLEIHTYVTQESEPPLEEGAVQKYVSLGDFSSPSRSGMSGLVGTGNIIWAGAYVLVPTIGFVVSLTLLNILYINPYNISYRWYKGLLLLICMVTSVIIFGGLVIGLWDRKTSSKGKYQDEKKAAAGIQHNESTSHKTSSDETFVNTIKYGQRPDIKEIFGNIASRWGNVDIGVIVCGPSTLQTSVAKECRSKNFGRRSNSPVFHFNSHSFDLSLPTKRGNESVLPSQEKAKWH
ncbi:putative ferric-chelate reductase (NADH) [Helianthus annuus]|uniref:Ferric-chelate reductase (NADH) n=2 Tax=Helianthus annuus TaxID=4232 RepID=A0A1Y3BUJ3_HELAN|nr:ferric reduction oxidase 7, chloroplastic isoform X1 [Helianthus annuus]KAF5813565.1 putative ferric-chelate reductase (NADH) [Helianthus annuus]KAJ0592292.1 putative ferric-chelate reductase (NADH) [Helianthus annuus]KAJ0599804.1 putative ferric-chelate reductase (NADH) [Helianthus annuus]KAJ0607278.1 putative ferric-chelate reductase (NADH) [Helianthus annuus]KAJ0767338.1 putative ferric-chelate reductase (NADH) [Helianthus annuus]